MKTNPAPRLKLFLASRQNEPGLMSLFSEKSRDGNIQINLDRGPDFFSALTVEGFENSVIAVEDTATGEIAGAGIRNLRKCYVNGEVRTIGYLSGLRVAEKYRKSRAMYYIFSKFRHMYLDGCYLGYLGSVFNNNKNALSVLTSRKAGMPKFSIAGKMVTCVFRPKTLIARNVPGLNIRKAKAEDIPSIIRFLNREGAEYQYFPYYTENDLSGKTGLLKNLNIDDIVLALSNNNIEGCLALWDQTAFRRWKVEKYSGSIARFRNIINFIFEILNLPQLPEENNNFNYRQLSLVCVKNSDPAIFRLLFNSSMQKLKMEDGILISASFFAGNPFLRIVPRLRMTFKSTIFLCYWDETEKQTALIDGRPPYIEAGSL